VSEPIPESTIETTLAANRDLEEVACLLCGSQRRRGRFRGHDRLHPTPGEFTLVECADCGFLYLSPRPTGAALARYYPSEYLSFRAALDEEPSALRRFERRLGLQRRCDVILQRKSRGALLDVGCGTGDFLAAMRDYPGWQVRGLEPSPDAAERARRSYGLSVDTGSLEAAPYPPGSYDVITMWDVLEHVPQPRAALPQLAAILRSGGLLVVGLPDRGSVDARLFGPYWAGLDVPRHFSVFTRAQIADLVQASGFAPPEIFNYNGGFHSFALSLRFWLGHRRAPGWLRDLILGTIGSPPGRLLSLPYFWLLQRRARAATMIVVARKV
jgi:SAM-dependent methyltransferase